MRGDREPLQPAVGADEVGHERRRRVAEDRRRGVVLLEDAADVAAPRSGRPASTASSMSWVTNTIVLRSSALQAEELVLQAGARDRVDRAERLVHQQHRRVGGQRPRHADALAAGRPTARPGSGRRTSPGSSPTSSSSSSTRAVRAGLVPAEQLRARCAMFARDRLVREQADLLDHVADAAAQLDRVDVGDVLAVEVDPAGGRLDEPVDHPQRRGLAAARRPDEHAHLAARDVEAELVHGDGPVRVPLADRSSRIIGCPVASTAWSLSSTRFK